MDFLQFKRRFIELYNQQKFKHFDSGIIDAVLPVLWRADNASLSASPVSLLELYSRFKIAFDDAAFLTSIACEVFSTIPITFAINFDTTKADVNRSVNLLKTSWIMYTIMVSKTTLHSSRFIDLLNSELRMVLPDFNRPRLHSSEVHILSQANWYVPRMNGSATMTFFTNWAYLGRSRSTSKVNYHAVKLNSSVNYLLSDVKQSAKLYSSVSMRSRTEHYVSDYDDNTTLANVADKTLYEFAYHEL